MELNSVYNDMIKLIDFADGDKNIPLVLFNNMVKNDFYLEGVKPSCKKDASFFRENKDVFDICKVTTVALYKYKNKEKTETSKKIAISVLEDLDKLDVFE